MSVLVKHKMKTETEEERDWGRKKLVSMNGDGDSHWLHCGAYFFTMHTHRKDFIP